MQTGNDSIASLFPALAKEAGREGFAAIAEKWTSHALAAGEVLIQSGQSVDSVFLLVSGRLTVTLMTGSTALDVGSHGPGAILGEVSLLDPGPSSATVRASEPSEVSGISRAALGALETEHPRAASAILHTLSHTLVERVRQATDRLDELLGAPAPREGLFDAARALLGIEKG